MSDLQTAVKSSARPIILNNPSRVRLSEFLRARVEKLGSKLPDQFDWTIYDQLQDRFGENQPRGGVIFKTTFKLVNYHESCSKCHYSFEIDSYGRGCVHNCTYCYAKDHLSSHGYWNRPIPFPVDLSQVRKIMFDVFETDKPSKWRHVLESRVPVRLGSMSDSFMWMDKKYGVTRELLRILNYYKYPHIIFTRSDLVADDLYLGILDKNLASVQMSISGDNEKLTKILEPGAPSVMRRIAALQKLNHHGVWTTVRLNPFFPYRPDGYFTDHENLKARFYGKEIPSFDLYSPAFFDLLKDVRVPSVLAGVVRLSMKAIIGIERTSGIDYRSFFRPEIIKSRGDKRYSDSEIAIYYLKLRTEAAKRGIRFSTCYIGNGLKDYFQYQNLWNNKKDCCDSIGNVPSFKTTSQSIPWDQRLSHAPASSVGYNGIAKSQDIERENLL